MINELFLAANGLELFAKRILILSIEGSLLVVVVLTLQRIFNRALSPTWNYAIWALVLARFVLIIAPESGFSFQNWIVNHQAESSPIEFEWVPDFFESSNNEYAAITTSSGVQISDTGQTQSINFGFYLALAWLLGSMFFLFRFLTAWRRTTLIAGNGGGLPSDAMQVFQEAKSWTGCNPKTKVIVTDSIDIPAATGLLVPRILLPTWCVEDLDQDQLRCVFIHELTHLQRRDIWMQLITQLISIVHWFNPLLILATNKT